MKPLNTDMKPLNTDMKPLNTDMNAQRWAKEFVELHGGDEDLMRSWFANAIMRGGDNHYWSTDEYKQSSKHIDIIWFLRLFLQTSTHGLFQDFLHRKILVVLCFLQLI